jgi:hypothetical protein
MATAKGLAIETHHPPPPTLLICTPEDHVTHLCARSEDSVHYLGVQQLREMFRRDNSARHQGPTMAAGLFKNGLESVLVLHAAAMTSLTSVLRFT